MGSKWAKASVAYWFQLAGQGAVTGDVILELLSDHDDLFKMLAPGIVEKLEEALQQEVNKHTFKDALGVVRVVWDVARLAFKDQLLVRLYAVTLEPPHEWVRQGSPKIKFFGGNAVDVVGGIVDQTPPTVTDGNPFGSVSDTELMLQARSLVVKLLQMEDDEDTTTRFHDPATVRQMVEDSGKLLEMVHDYHQRKLTDVQRLGHTTGQLPVGEVSAVE